LRKGRVRRITSWCKAMLFVAPALFFYIVFLIRPIIDTFQISLHRWNGMTPHMEFIGFANYRSLVRDPIFIRALFNNVYWMLFTIFVPVLLGLILAVIVNQKFVKFRMLFRVAYFVPTVVSLVAVAIVWRWIYSPLFGILTRSFEAFGMRSPDWLGDPNWALFSLLITGSWTYYGFCMVIFMAALAGVDPTYNEVALIEGANPFQKFIYVTIPLVKNTITLLVLNSLIGSFRVFELVYVMTRGGPFRSTEVIATYMVSTAFNLNDVGLGAAIAIVLAVIIAIFSIGYLMFIERRGSE